MVRHILAIDGGGIRGIIPALVLAEIEKRTKRPIAEMFDMVAGTSTGGIVGAGISLKNDKGQQLYSANDMVELYQKHGPELFDASLKRQLESMCCGPLYPSSAAENLLAKYFGENTLGNIPNKLLLTSYDMVFHKPLIFKSWKKEHKDIKVKDAVRATTAAPTYFPPKQLVVSNVERCLVDGGVVDNNPAACAYASAKKLYPNDEFTMLSIGCGQKNEPIICDSTKHWGKAAWIMPLIELLMQSKSVSIGYQMKQLLGTKYVRIESILDKASYSVDDASKKNLKAMHEDAIKTIAYYDKMMDKYLKQVIKP